MLSSLSSTWIFEWLLIMARVGTMFVILPALGETYMFSRARLWIAVSLSVLLIPTVKATLPAEPSSVVMMVWFFAHEIIIGAFLGIIARIMLATLHTAGLMIASGIGLTAGSLFDPSQQGQGSELGLLFTLTALLLIFQTDVHHLWIRGLVNSYDLFSPRAALPLEQFTEYLSRGVANSFALALTLAAPNLVLGMIIGLLGGIMARLMPQMNVFFIALPAQIWAGFAVILMALSSLLLWYMDKVEEGAYVFMK